MTSIALPKSKPLPKRAISGPTIKAPAVAILDFETEAITKRGMGYPPKPVSFSLQRSEERKPTFYAWGHPEGNNIEREKAYRVLQDLFRWALREGNSILFQHAKFDIDVAQTHAACVVLPWDRIHDTEYLIFLADPHSKTLSLKPSAERILGTKPEERDAVRDWLVAHKFVTKKQKDWGAFISKAPAQIVGPYANGDVIRTDKLFRHLYGAVAQRGMLAAYNRERRLMPTLLRTEREGIRTDLPRMEADYVSYLKARDRVDGWLRKRLNAPDLNLDADKDVGDALDREGVVTEWTWTAGGNGRAPQRSVSKKNMLLTSFKDKQVAAAYGYRGRLQTCLSMFMETWLAQARVTGGTIHTDWSQVRQDRNGGQVGTRSGRLSSSPNFQNISKDFEGRTDGYTHPAFLRGLPRLPLMRQYLLPDKGCVWARRDINQQELRLLAHFEGGELMHSYNRQDELAERTGDATQRLDVHTIVQQGIRTLMNMEFERQRVKTFDFQNVYGAGVTAAAEALGVNRGLAQQVIGVLMKVLPGYERLLNDCKNRGERPIVTWGGREYYCEPPAYSKKYKRVMTYDYKRLNYLIQPSAADVTKEITIRYDEHPKREARFLLTVHDEFDASMQRRRVKEDMAVLKECIESIETDVKMVSDGETGPNWGTLEDYVDIARTKKTFALAAKSGGR